MMCIIMNMKSTQMPLDLKISLLVLEVLTMEVIRENTHTTHHQLTLHNLYIYDKSQCSHFAIINALRWWRPRRTTRWSGRTRRASRWSWRRRIWTKRRAWWARWRRWGRSRGPRNWRRWPIWRRSSGLCRRPI